MFEKEEGLSWMITTSSQIVTKSQDSKLRQQLNRVISNNELPHKEQQMH